MISVTLLLGKGGNGVHGFRFPRWGGEGGKEEREKRGQRRSNSVDSKGGIRDEHTIPA